MERWEKEGCGSGGGREAATEFGSRGAAAFQPFVPQSGECVSFRGALDHHRQSKPVGISSMSRVRESARPTGDDLESRAKYIEQAGLDVVIQYEERNEGRYACLRMDPGPGFVHLSSAECVAECLRDYGQYHSTILWKGKTFQRFGPGSNARDAFLVIKNKFSKPVRARLCVAFVNRRTFVVNIDPEDPVMKDVYGKMKFLRMHFGNHTHPFVTVSL